MINTASTSGTFMANSGQPTYGAAKANINTGVSRWRGYRATGSAGCNTAHRSHRHGR
jgi:NAD(P)-dependent dehydrogenase (short-subunit alcohol dehydrogenase family)